MVEGFKIIDEVTKTSTAVTNIFDSNITFLDTPEGFAREIQVQVFQSVSTNFSVIFNTISYDIDNAAAVKGVITFTMLIRRDDTLNFQTLAGTELTIIVAGG